MFMPNLIGQIASVIGRDVHGRTLWGDYRPCPFGIVNLDVGALKTSVRADSSASRGSADETVAMRAKILIAPEISVNQGDRFLFEDATYVVASTHKRRSVSTGQVDHIEVGLEVLP